jgi:hypothetical protein
VFDQRTACGIEPCQLTDVYAGAISFYQRLGFAVREAVVFEIGNGFVIDDYVMEKPLGGILPQV